MHAVREGGRQSLQRHRLNIDFRHAVQEAEAEAANVLLNIDFRLPIKLDICGKTFQGHNCSMGWRVHQVLTCCDRGCHSDTLLLVLVVSGRASPHQAYTVAQSLHA